MHVTKPRPNHLQKLDPTKKGKARTKFRINTGNHTGCYGQLGLTDTNSKMQHLHLYLSLNRVVRAKIKPKY